MFSKMVLDTSICFHGIQVASQALYQFYKWHLQFQNRSCNRIYLIPDFGNAILKNFYPIREFPDAILKSFCPIADFYNAIK